MKKKILWVVISVFYIYACASNEKINIKNVPDTSFEIEKTIRTASESIIANLPSNATVAFFNNSTEEIDLMNHIIEEISLYLTNNSSFIIVERERFEAIEKEQRWQMETGYVPDEEMLSIVGRLGAQYVVSSFISGNSHLQRLRIKTWDTSTGQIIVQSAYPTNALGVTFIREVRKIENPYEITEFKNIRQNGITVDYEEFDDDIQFQIYIDGTLEYFFIDFYISDFNKYEDKHDYNIAFVNLKNQNNVIEYFDYGTLFVNNNTNIYDLEMKLSAFLINQGIDRRNTNNISRIILMIILEYLKSI